LVTFNKQSYKQIYKIKLARSLIQLHTMAQTATTTLCFAPSLYSSKSHTVRLTADQFGAVPAGTLFEVTERPDTPVKPYFAYDFMTSHPDVIPCELDIAFHQLRCFNYIRGLFTGSPPINFCQRIRPGKISLHFTVSGIVTTKAAIKAKLQVVQGGINNSPFDLRWSYNSYQTLNAPGHAKQDAGPQMEVVRGTPKDNLVSHLNGDEAEIDWGES
jgi:hypothetical protein